MITKNAIYSEKLKCTGESSPDAGKWSKSTTTTTKKSLLSTLKNKPN